MNMRIISQDGTVDMPYDRVVVQILPSNPKAIIAFESLTGDDFLDMGIYSTPKKAMKVMEMLRNKYTEYLSTNGGALATANFYVQPGVWNIPKVFQFPQDDEIGEDEKDAKEPRKNND